MLLLKILNNSTYSSCVVQVQFMYSSCTVQIKCSYSSIRSVCESGDPRWDRYPVKILLKKDVEENKYKVMAPRELWKFRKKYQDFTNDFKYICKGKNDFWKHIYQAIYGKNPHSGSMSRSKKRIRKRKLGKQLHPCCIKFLCCRLLRVYCNVVCYKII